MSVVMERASKETTDRHKGRQTFEGRDRIQFNVVSEDGLLLGDVRAALRPWIEALDAEDAEDAEDATLRTREHDANLQAQANALADLERVGRRILKAER